MSWAIPMLGALAATAPEAVSAEFRWDAPAGCPTNAEVQANLEEVLGRPLSSFTGRHISVIARARPGEAGWDLKLWTVSLETTHERVLQSESCETAAEAAVVVAALAIDPPPDVAPEPLPEPSPKPLPGNSQPGNSQPDDSQPNDSQPHDPPVSEPQGEEPPRPSVLLGAHAGPSWGAMPGLGAVAGLRLGLQWTRLRVELDARYAFVRDARYANQPDVGADLRHAYVVGRGCAVVRPTAKLQVPVCGGVEAGAMLGRGVGLAQPKSDSIPWLALQVRTGLVGMVHPRVGLSVAAEPYIAVLRPAFQIQPVGVLWRPRAGGVRATAGFELRL